MMMSIENPGPKISEEDIALIENDFGLIFPESYRKFLLSHNGGSPELDTIDIDGVLDSPTDVQVFFGIGRLIESSNLRWNFENCRNLCPNGRILPIACDSGGNIFSLDFYANNEAKVVYFDMSKKDNPSYDVAPDFDHFIARLRKFD